MSLKLQLPKYATEDDVDLTAPASLKLLNVRSVEPIGYWYHMSAAVTHDLSTNVYYGAKPAGLEAEEEAATQVKEEVQRSTSDGKFTKLTDEDKETDFYDVLKLESGEGATENEIRAAYRRRCLDTHPDKQPDRSDVMFKKVQRAFEILVEPHRRRAYDSSRPFDDTIPEPDDKMDMEEFFLIYKPVFNRNRKWSVDNRIPNIGDKDTPLKEVNRIYDAWYRFASWRDFSHEADLEEIKEGMSREEKRYYQRENQRLVDGHKRKEAKRVRTLVERAQKADPRIRLAREADIAAKEKEKQDRLAEKERIRGEELARKAAIAAKSRADQQVKTVAAVADRSRIKECEDELLAFFTKAGLMQDISTNLIQPFAVRKPNIVYLFSKIKETEEAEEVLTIVSSEPVAAIEDKSVPAVLAFNNFVLIKEMEVGSTRYGEGCKRLTPEDLAAKKAAEADRRNALRAKIAGN